MVKTLRGLFLRINRKSQTETTLFTLFSKIPITVHLHKIPSTPYSMTCKIKSSLAIFSIHLMFLSEIYSWISNEFFFLRWEHSKHLCCYDLHFQSVQPSPCIALACHRRGTLNMNVIMNRCDVIFKTGLQPIWNHCIAMNIASDFIIERPISSAHNIIYI